jgi:hypothetical protein
MPPASMILFSYQAGTNAACFGIKSRWPKRERRKGRNVIVYIFFLTNPFYGWIIKIEGFMKSFPQKQEG